MSNYVVVEGRTETLYHGTSRDNMDKIMKSGFIGSSNGCLGPGIYLATHTKATGFANHAAARGHGFGAVVIRAECSFQKAKFVNSNDSTWRTQGFDACHADETTSSNHAEWCFADDKQVIITGWQQAGAGEQNFHFMSPGSVQKAVAAPEPEYRPIDLMQSEANHSGDVLRNFDEAIQHKLFCRGCMSCQKMAKKSEDVSKHFNNGGVYHSGANNPCRDCNPKHFSDGSSEARSAASGDCKQM